MALSAADFNTLYKRGDHELRNLSDVVLKGRQPPPAPYAFFHHSGHSIQRLSDVHRITRRLVDGRQSLTKLIALEEAARPDDWPAGVKYPPEVSDAMTRTSGQVSDMRVDFESLYLFGQLLLDQWSLQVLLVGAPDIKRDHPFTRLVVGLDAGTAPDVADLWERHRAEALWLFWHLRFYRNRFIAHASRPWQRGCTFGHVTDTFQLHTPSPPGWLDGDEKAKEVRELFGRMPRDLWGMSIDVTATSPQRLLEIMFGKIGEVADSTLRQEVGSLYGDLGGSTPTFQVVARNLLSFVTEATPTLTEIAVRRLDLIEL